MLELFAQYNVELAGALPADLPQTIAKLKEEIAELEDEGCAARRTARRPRTQLTKSAPTLEHR